MARPERVELPTFWFVARRSIQLSYGRIRLGNLPERAIQPKNCTIPPLATSVAQFFFQSGEKTHDIGGSAHVIARACGAGVANANGDLSF